MPFSEEGPDSDGMRGSVGLLLLPVIIKQVTRSGGSSRAGESRVGRFDLAAGTFAIVNGGFYELCCVSSDFDYF